MSIANDDTEEVQEESINWEMCESVARQHGYKGDVSDCDDGDFECPDCPFV
jgi:hypothetical protein